MPCAMRLPRYLVHLVANGRAKSMARTKSLAETVKAWRIGKGLSAAAAADMLGLPVRTLEGIEQGRPFRYEKMLRLALNGC